MFFVLVKRVVRYVTSNSADRFQPRTANRESWTVNGPFTRRKTAEQAAMAALGQHTCLLAQVMSAAALESLAAADSFDQPDHALGVELRRARKLYLASAPFVCSGDEK